MYSIPTKYIMEVFLDLTVRHRNCPVKCLSKLIKHRMKLKPSPKMLYHKAQMRQCRNILSIIGNRLPKYEYYRYKAQVLNVG